MTRRTSDDIIEAAIEKYTSGWGAPSIATHLGISWATVYRHLRLRGIDTSRKQHRPGCKRIRKLSLAQREEAVARALAGETLEAIGASYGVRFTSIAKHVQKAVGPRDRWGNKKGDGALAPSP